MRQRSRPEEPQTRGEPGQAARIALAAIVADPDLGPSVLSSPPVLSNLLPDYLPDSPRATAPISSGQTGDNTREPPTALLMTSLDYVCQVVS